MIIGRPARELGPCDRLELSAREFQRFFGGCTACREAYERADDACGHLEHSALHKRVPHHDAAPPDSERAMPNEVDFLA